MNILVVDDSLTVRRLIETTLKKEFSRIHTAVCGESALASILLHKPAIVILDIMMPNLSGIEVCLKIRKNPKIYGDPYILILTGRDDDDDVISGFEAGADDYLKKPFNPKELSLRVKASLRKNRVSNNSLYYKNITLFKDSRRVEVDGTDVKLSSKLFNLLLFLIENSGISLSRERIYLQVWEEEFLKGNRTVDVYLRRLKDKIPDLEGEINSQSGFGYRLG